MRRPLLPASTFAKKIANVECKNAITSFGFFLNAFRKKFAYNKVIHADACLFLFVCVFVSLITSTQKLQKLEQQNFSSTNADESMVCEGISTLLSSSRDIAINKCAKNLHITPVVSRKKTKPKDLQK